MFLSKTKKLLWSALVVTRLQFSLFPITGREAAMLKRHKAASYIQLQNNACCIFLLCVQHNHLCCELCPYRMVLKMQALISYCSTKRQHALHVDTDEARFLLGSWVWGAVSARLITKNVKLQDSLLVVKTIG